MHSAILFSSPIQLGGVVRPGAVMTTAIPMDAATLREEGAYPMKMSRLALATNADTNPTSTTGSWSSIQLGEWLGLHWRLCGRNVLQCNLWHQ